MRFGILENDGGAASEGIRWWSHISAARAAHHIWHLPDVVGAGSQCPTGFDAYDWKAGVKWHPGDSASDIAANSGLGARKRRTTLIPGLKRPGVRILGMPRPQQ